MSENQPEGRSRPVWIREAGWLLLALLATVPAGAYSTVASNVTGGAGATRHPFDKNSQRKVVRADDGACYVVYSYYSGSRNQIRIARSGDCATGVGELHTLDERLLRLLLPLHRHQRGGDRAPRRLLPLGEWRPGPLHEERLPHRDRLEDHGQLDQGRRKRGTGLRGLRAELLQPVARHLRRQRDLRRHRGAGGRGGPTPAFRTSPTPGGSNDAGQVRARSSTRTGTARSGLPSSA